MGCLRIDRLTGGGAALVVEGCLLADRCYLARTPWARAVGLLGTPDLAPGEALWIPRCRSVHTVGMRRPIACAFLDDEGVVLRVVGRLDPWRWAAEPAARAVVEAGVSSLETVAPGQRLTRATSSPGRRPPAAIR